LATPETLAIMRARFEDMPDTDQQPLKYGESVRVGDVDVGFAPAGHILGSAQAVLAYKGQRIVVSANAPVTGRARPWSSSSWPA
jgi:putative mRNA 3-end processing factor